MGIQNSQHLLTEILMLLQNLNSSVMEFQIELKNLKDDAQKINNRLENFISTYMPSDVAERHVRDHREMNTRFFKKIFKRKRG